MVISLSTEKKHARVLNTNTKVYHSFYRECVSRVPYLCSWRPSEQLQTAANEQLSISISTPKWRTGQTKLLCAVNNCVTLYEKLSSIAVPDSYCYYGTRY